MDNKGSIFDAISFVASIASLILAIGAIWLSVVFYKMSNTASNATTKAADGIAASVERLEKLFDKLYSDTFSMMQETVSDMRRHMWPSSEDPEQEKIIEEAEKKADEKIDDLKKSLESQISEVLKQQRSTDSAMSGVRNEIRDILDQAIVRSRQADVEAREETVREHLLRTIRVVRRVRPKVTLDDVVERLQSRFDVSRLLTEIEKLKDEKIIETSSESLTPSTEVRIRPRFGRSTLRDEPLITPEP